MQTKRDRLGLEMTLLPPLETLIPEDHHLRRLDRVLDLSFVHESVRDRYCQTNGRPSIDPEVVLRLFLLQAVEGIPHVRDLMRQVAVNLAYRWFIGYRVDEKLPDHSTLSRALDRFGDDVFNELFVRSVSQCQKSGLIEGKVLHLDATTIRADLDANRVNQPDSPDKDARFGRFPNGTKQPGYKQHALADGKKRVVVGVTVTPANSPDDSTMTEMIDDAIDRLGSPPEAICADSAYSSGENAACSYGKGLRLVSPPRKARNHHSHEQFTIEQFEYDEKSDNFICPAGKILKKAGRMSGRKDRFKYRASAIDCRSCPLKSQCTKSPHRSLNVSSNHGSLVRLRADYKTESFKKLYRQRSPVIEGVFAEAKQWHGLGRAWRRGLSKMLVQCLLVAAVINLKRLGAVAVDLFNLQVMFNTILDAIERIMKASERCCSMKMLSLANLITDAPRRT